MNNFLGFVSLGSDLLIPLLTRAASTLAIATPDANPTYAIYDADGTLQQVAGGTGSFAKRHSGSVSNATDSGGLIKITTSAAHGLSSGAVVTLASVGGVSGANGTFKITVVDSTSYTLDGSTFSGSYTSGGTWYVTGLYSATHSIDTTNYSAGQTYSVLCNWAVSSAQMGQVYSFTVV